MNHGIERNDQIKVYDEYGRERLISREVWRAEVLPASLRANWNHADSLYAIVVAGLNDGLYAEVVAAAKHFFRLDPTARGACLYGIALMKCCQIDEAERILRTYTMERGEDGPVLTNLAKVYSAKGDKVKTDETLKRALEVDPNQENGLNWYTTRERERAGAPAEHEALVRVANLPGSWRAQLFLARAELRSGNYDGAAAYYQQAFRNAKKPIPVDLLTCVSGDLGNAGRLRESIDLVEPHFDVDAHGIQVGNNLIKAHVDLREPAAARKILEGLYALQRPDWREALDYWDNEISKATVEAHRLDGANVNTSVLAVEGPIWTSSTSLANAIFPPPSAGAPLFAFLGSTAELSDPDPFKAQLTNAPGRLSRALPLFLAEQVCMATAARVTTLIPWIAGPPCGFVLGGSAWPDSWAVAAAQRGESPASYITTVHLVAKGDEWGAELRVVHVSDADCLGLHHVAFPRDEPHAAVRVLARAAIDILTGASGLPKRDYPTGYVPPEGNEFASYLVRLEQLLAVRCASLKGAGASFLHAPRAILDGNLDLCLRCPTNPLTRILLVETLAKMDLCLPGVVAEYSKKIALLEKNCPLTGYSASVVKRMLSSVRSLST